MIILPNSHYLIYKFLFKRWANVLFELAYPPSSPSGTGRHEPPECLVFLLWTAPGSAPAPRGGFCAARPSRTAAGPPLVTWTRLCTIPVPLWWPPCTCSGQRSPRCSWCWARRRVYSGRRRRVLPWRPRLRKKQRHTDNLASILAREVSYLADSIAQRNMWDDKIAMHDHTMYHTIPYSGIRYKYCTVPYRTIPYRTVPYRNVLYHTIPYRIIPYRIIPYRIIPYRTIPCRTVPCQTIPYQTKAARQFTNATRSYEGCQMTLMDDWTNKWMNGWMEGYVDGWVVWPIRSLFSEVLIHGSIFWLAYCFVNQCYEILR